MPHDKNGAPLKVGDKVTVECEVTSVQPGTDYCNLSVKTVEPMHPGKEATTITLNTKQVVKAVVFVLAALFGFASPAAAQSQPRVYDIGWGWTVPFDGPVTPAPGAAVCNTATGTCAPAAGGAVTSGVGGQYQSASAGRGVGRRPLLFPRLRAGRGGCR